MERLLEVEEIPGEDVLDLLGTKDKDNNGDLSDDGEWSWEEKRMLWDMWTFLRPNSRAHKMAVQEAALI